MELLYCFNAVNIFSNTALVGDNDEQVIFLLQIFQRLRYTVINNKMFGQVIIVASFFNKNSVTVKESRPCHGIKPVMELIKSRNSSGFNTSVNKKPKTAPHKCASWLICSPARFAA